MGEVNATISLPTAAEQLIAFLLRFPEKQGKQLEWFKNQQKDALKACRIVYDQVSCLPDYARVRLFRSKRGVNCVEMDRNFNPLLQDGVRWLFERSINSSPVSKMAEVYGAFGVWLHFGGGVWRIGEDVLARWSFSCADGIFQPHDRPYPVCVEFKFFTDRSTLEMTSEDFFRNCVRQFRNQVSCYQRAIQKPMGYLLTFIVDTDGAEQKVLELCDDARQKEELSDCEVLIVRRRNDQVRGLTPWCYINLNPD
jgi:hypothetical protein